MRKLVTVRTVGQITPIENADAIECISVDGWQVVAKKGEFKEGDKCVYFEIDSFLPTDDVRFSFLAKNGTKTDSDGVERVRLRTIRLRGQISQGLALPLHLFPEIVGLLHTNQEDFSETVNVIKYEQPEKALGRAAAGTFPWWIRKTDEERIQNCYGRFAGVHKDTMFVPTLKLDGTSTTIAYVRDNKQELWVGAMVAENEDGLLSYLSTKGLEDVKDGEVTLYSRNQRLKWDINGGSHYTNAVFNGNIQHKIVALSNHLGVSVAIQGETMGEGIQGNPEKFREYRFYAFNIFDIDNQEYLHYDNVIALFEKFDILSVPLLGEPEKVFETKTLQEILDHADGESINAKVREGVVWKSVGVNPPVSFKAISNNFLLKVEK